MLSSRVPRVSSSVVRPLVRCLSAISAEPAARPQDGRGGASSSQGGPAGSGAPRARILPPEFQRRINTPEQDLAIYRAGLRKNALLGTALALFVAGIWGYSVYAVTAVKDSFTTPEVQQIQQELDREESAKAK